MAQRSRLSIGLKMSVIDRYEKAKKLPPGHYERTNAKKAIDEEYKYARILEEFWMKKLKKKIINIDPNRGRYDEKSNENRKLIIKEIIITLCDEIGSKRPKEIVYDYSLIPKGAGACYIPIKKTIALGYPGILSGVHELAHHISFIERISIKEMPKHLAFLGEEIVSAMHGKSFLWSEDLLFQTLSKVLGAK